MTTPFNLKINTFQIRDQFLKGLRPKARITVKRHMDQSTTLWLKNQALTFEAVSSKKEEKKKMEKKGHNSHIQSKNARANKHKTPWGQFNQEWLNTSGRLPTGHTTCLSFE